MFYHFKIHKEKKSYWAECVEIDGIFTEAKTKNELEKNVEAALHLHMAEPQGSNIVFPNSKKSVKGTNIFKVRPKSSAVFANELRRLRLSKKLTQSQTKKMLGLEHLTSYQRLENPNSSNPKLTTLIKIKEAFPSFSLDKFLYA